MTTAVLESPVEPLVETNYERAKRIYLARTPWHYDARFHVLPQHVRHTPAFIEPPPTPYRVDVDRGSEVWRG